MIELGLDLGHQVKDLLVDRGGAHGWWLLGDCHARVVLGLGDLSSEKSLNFYHSDYFWVG